MNPEELVNQLRAKGVILSAHDGQIHYWAPEGVLTQNVKAALKRHKPQVMRIINTARQSIINQVTRCGSHPCRSLSDQEFTERYLILIKAWQNGVIDDRSKDEGLDFLLDHWRLNRQYRQ
jgi:hypothetical protein